MNDYINSRPSRRTVMSGALAAGIAALASAKASPASALVVSQPVKLVCVLRRKPSLTPAQFYDYWLNTHGPFAAEQVKILGATRYVQSHTTDESLNLTLQASRGTKAAYDGITEVWFPSDNALALKYATPEGLQASLRLAEDEKKFIDLADSSYFLTREHVIFG